MNIEFDIKNGGKTLIITNVVTLLLAIASIIWNAAQMDQTLQQIEDNQERFRTRIIAVETTQDRQGNRLTHLETTQTSVLLDVDRLETFHFGGEIDEPSRDSAGDRRFDPRRGSAQASGGQRRGARDTATAGSSRRR